MKQFNAAANGTVLDLDLALDYGPFEGSNELRERVALLHSTPDGSIGAENVIITPGSILANFLILDAICQPGDHAICQYPVFSQLHLLPQHRGVDVSLWQLTGDGLEPGVATLRSLVKKNTRAIILKYRESIPTANY